MLCVVYSTLINRLVRCFSFFSRLVCVCVCVDIFDIEQQQSTAINAGKKTEIKLQTYVR